MRKSKGSRNRGTTRKQRNGIFCLEGDYWDRLDQESTVRPILELLNQHHLDYAPFIFRNAATAEQLKYYLQTWTRPQYDRFPILYLAFHGDEGMISAGEENAEMDLDDFEATLGDRCRDRMIHFASCGPVGVHGNRLNRFLTKTGALAVSGYAGETDWHVSSAFDLLLLGELQRNTMTLNGLRAVRDRIQRTAPVLIGELGFRMKLRKPIS